MFSRQAPVVLWGMARCLRSLGTLPEVLVWDREGCLHGGGGRPTDSYAAFCGGLKTGWLFCEPADPQAKGVVERLQEYMETNFEPGRRFANHLDYQLLALDRDGAGPLGAQLERELREAIRSQRLSPGERLPSSRRLATELGVSRGLIQECYAQLVAEGVSALAAAPELSWPPAQASQLPPPPISLGCRARDRRSTFVQAGLTFPASRATSGYGRCATPPAPRPTPRLATATRTGLRSCARSSQAICAESAAPSPIPSES